MSPLVLENEAVDALRDAHHPKHRNVVSHLQAVVGRRRRGDLAVVVVPCAVRAEAGWDRSTPGAAAINRYRVAEVPLDTPRTDLAAQIISGHQVSVADAHLGASVRYAGWDDAAVLSSNPADMHCVCTPLTIRAIRI